MFLSPQMKLCGQPAGSIRRSAAFAARAFLSALFVLILFPAAAENLLAQNGAAALLEVGHGTERELSGGQSHSYRIEATAGQFLYLVVEQRGIDVVATLFGPDGKPVLEVDSPNGAQGPEPLTVITDAAGAYRLEVRSLEKEAAAGRYEAKLIERRAATEQDRNRVAAQKAYTEAELLRGEMTADSLRRAIAKYLEAMPLAHAAGAQQLETDSLVSVAVLRTMLGERQKALEDYAQALMLSRAALDRNNEAVILNNLGAVYNDLGQQQKALEYYAQALPIYRALEERGGQARTLNNIGRVYDDLGDKQQALDHYMRALPLSHAAHDTGNEATILNNLGKVYNDLGENQKALDYYARALPLLRGIGDRRSEAIVLNNIGRIYGDLGEKEKALEYFQQALPALRAAGDRNFEALTLNNIGGIQSNIGDKQKALEYYAQALSIWRAVGDRKAEAITLLNIGAAYDDLGEKQKALENYLLALPLNRATGDRGNEATTLNNIGWFYYKQGDAPKALEHYEQALLLQRAIGNRRGEATTLDNIALLERDQGKLSAALQHQEAAVSLLESLRTKVVSQELRASYFATVQESYQLLVDILMRLHRQHPSEGYAGRALQATERGRARSLLEVLAEAGGDVRAGADPQLLERERALQKQLETKEAAQIKLLSGAHTAEQAAAIKREMQALLEQYQEVEAQIKRDSPRYAALTQPQPLDLAAMQKQLDEGTLLLEYALGGGHSPQSYLWVVSNNSLKSYELAASSADIEKAARHFYGLLDARNQRPKGETRTAREARVARADAELPEASAALSRMLLAPVAAQLGKKRLVIVGEGALQYIPFAALTVNRLPLVTEHEIVTLPSASTIALIRRETAGRTPAPKMLAVLADPIFEKDDVRLQTALQSAPPSEEKPAGAVVPDTRILEQEDEDESESGSPTSFLLGRRRIKRLPYTRQEAERILALAPSGASMSALDFKANRATAVSPDLGQYRFVHFATHGYLDAERPELSALVLSLVDERGEAQPGFLRAHEIYNLKLSAEMVVLSACQTGLGKEIKGEGLVGLTRGFMYAGAPRVAVSLWAVSDQATADLMEKFYRGMLIEKLRPADALRAAQVRMMKETRWSSPYYWAAFTLQGEWR